VERYGVGGARCRVLFSLQGYAPHYAEHIHDPTSGRDVLVMADPHIRRSAYIYDTSAREVIWECPVPGNSVSANPHIARLITEEVPSISAEPGDILCADRENRYVVIGRGSREVKWSWRPEDAGWSHDAMVTKSLDGLIITDYSSGFVRRVNLRGETVWNRNLGRGVAKLSRIEGGTPSGMHSNSFGGDLLVAVNQSLRGVYELREEDGHVAWACAPSKGDKNVFLTLRPHAALRLGLAEFGGNLTVFNHEAGGGIVAVDRECRPRFGVMKPLTKTDAGEIYRPSSTGLMETTHVFTTLDGRLGAIDWNGRFRSTVYEFEEIPRSTRLYWLLAWERVASPTPEFLDPPIETSEWSETDLEIINHGDRPVTWTVESTNMPYVDWSTRYWRRLEASTIQSGMYADLHIEKSAAVRVSVKSEPPNSLYSIFVSQKP